MRQRLYMETTSVAAEKTIAKINNILLEFGATHILHDCQGGQIVGLSFVLPIGGRDIPYKLPARFESVYRAINSRRPIRNRERYAQQDMSSAVRIAWRQLYRWLEAQLAMVQTGMVTADEILLPYMRMKGNQSLYELTAAENGRRLLPLLESSVT